MISESLDLASSPKPGAPGCDLRDRPPLRYPSQLEVKGDMSCRSCGSENRTEFPSEISVHISGLENVNKPMMMVFPRLLVCMDCGFTELTLTRNELRLLGNEPASDVEAAG